MSALQNVDTTKYDMYIKTTTLNKFINMIKDFFFFWKLDSKTY